MNNVPVNDNPPPWLAKGYALLFALLPWSVDVNFGRWNLSVPSEPLILLIGLGLALEISRTPFRFLRVPKSLLPTISFLWILCMAISCGSSSMKIVSGKYWIVEAGQWWVFAVGPAIWPGLWRRVLPYFMVSMLGVVIYTVIHHSLFAFRADQALLAPMPFFPDHTMYAAVLVMLIFFVQMPVEASAGPRHFFQKALTKKGIAVFFLSALILSTCRSAMLSLLLGVLVYAGYYFREKHRYLVPGMVGLGLLFYPFAGGKISHALSNDVSFQERLNRWDCAESMLDARPWTGFGPGTYPFQYLPFQRQEKMTRISVHAPLTERGPDTYGRGGSAHSEYWQAASEMGWPGLTIWIALVFTTLWLGFRQAVRAPNKEDRQLALLITLGLLTYFIHGLANNFLHDGRVAALVWGGIGLLGFRVKGTVSNA